MNREIKVANSDSATGSSVSCHIYPAPVDLQARPESHSSFARLFMSLSKRSVAEFIGTFWLVFGGCGSAVLAAGFPQTGIGFAGVALAFGLTLLTMAYTIGPISGCHINPAVTFGLWLAERFPARDVLPYWIAQVVGAIAAAAVLYVIASGKPGFVAGQFASNGYGPLS